MYSYHLQIYNIILRTNYVILNFLLQTDKEVTLLEVGCGVGNFIYPLLEEKTNFFFYACDFSERAVQFVKVCHFKIP